MSSPPIVPRPPMGGDDDAVPTAIIPTSHGNSNGGGLLQRVQVGDTSATVSSIADLMGSSSIGGGRGGDSIRGVGQSGSFSTLATTATNNLEVQSEPHHNQQQAATTDGSQLQPHNNNSSTTSATTAGMDFPNNSTNSTFHLNRSSGTQKAGGPTTATTTSTTDIIGGAVGGGNSLLGSLSGRVTETNDGDAQPQYHRKRDHDRHEENEEELVEERDYLVGENQRLRQESMRLVNCCKNMEELYQRKCNQVASLELQLACLVAASDNGGTGVVSCGNGGAGISSCNIGTSAGNSGLMPTLFDGSTTTSGGPYRPTPGQASSFDGSVVTNTEDVGGSLMATFGDTSATNATAAALLLFQQQQQALAGKTSGSGFKRHRKKNRSNTPNTQSAATSNGGMSPTSHGVTHQCVRHPVSGHLCCPPGYRMAVEATASGDGSGEVVGCGSCVPPPATDHQGTMTTSAATAEVDEEADGQPSSATNAIHRTGVYGQISDHTQQLQDDVIQQQQQQHAPQLLPSANRIRCDLCNIYVNSEGVLETHLKGEKHRRAVNRRNAALQQQQQQQQQHAPHYQFHDDNNHHHHAGGDVGGVSYQQQQPSSSSGSGFGASGGGAEYDNFSGGTYYAQQGGQGQQQQPRQHNPYMDAPPPPPPPPPPHRNHQGPRWGL